MTAADGVLAVMICSLTAYALLAGADFGGGAWDLLARGRHAKGERRLISHALGPVWEANHVWLIFVIVATFSGFPSAFGLIARSLELPLAFALAGIVLRSTRPTVMPGVLYRLFSARAKLERHRQVDGFTGVRDLVVRTTDGRPIPLQVDGDYIGDVTEAVYRVDEEIGRAHV